MVLLPTVRVPVLALLQSIQLAGALASDALALQARMAESARGVGCVA